MFERLWRLFVTYLLILVSVIEIPKLNGFIMYISAAVVIGLVITYSFSKIEDEKK